MGRYNEEELQMALAEGEETSGDARPGFFSFLKEKWRAEPLLRACTRMTWE